MYDSPEEIRDYSVKGKWRIPINMHIGNMGLAQATGVPIITSPPSRTGGNIDNKRIGIGGKQSCDRLLYWRKTPDKEQAKPLGLCTCIFSLSELTGQS